MPAPNKAVSSHRSLVFVINPTTLDTLPLTFVENFTAEKAVMSENFITVGSPIPPDNTINIEQGRISWTRVYTQTPELTRVITPRIKEYCQYQAYRLLVVDPCDGKAIALVIDALPEAFGILLTGGRAARSNYTGLCRVVLLEDEINEAIGV